MCEWVCVSLKRITMGCFDSFFSFFAHELDLNTFWMVLKRGREGAQWPSPCQISELGCGPNGSIVLNFARAAVPTLSTQRWHGRSPPARSVCFCFFSLVKQVKSNGHCVGFCHRLLCGGEPAPGAFDRAVKKWFVLFSIVVGFSWFVVALSIVCFFFGSFVSLSWYLYFFYVHLPSVLWCFCLRMCCVYLF